jgi:hypothetical protein
MYKAIETRYHGPTNTKGGRISARSVDNPPMYREYDHGLHHSQRHAAVAKAYAEARKWPGLYVAGYTPGSGYVFVNIGREISPSMIAGHTLKIHPLGFEGEDWFYVSEERA